MYVYIWCMYIIWFGDSILSGFTPNPTQAKQSLLPKNGCSLPKSVKSWASEVLWPRARASISWMLQKASIKTTTAIIWVTHLRSHLNLSKQIVRTIQKIKITPIVPWKGTINLPTINFQGICHFSGEYHLKTPPQSFETPISSKWRIHRDALDSITPQGERIMLWEGFLGSILETRSLAIRNFRGYLPKWSENDVLSKEKGRLSNSRGSHINISKYVHTPPEN